MLRYILNILIAIDQLVNTMIGGYPDETLSAAAWFGEQQGKLVPRIMRPVIDFIFWPIERDHCAKAFRAERKGLQLPEGYRDN